MSGTNTFIVAVEDLATATTVAVEGARLAMANDARRLVLLHLLDHHPVMSAVMGMSGFCTPVVESNEEAEQILRLAEQALRAEFAALERPAPEIQHEIAADEHIAVGIERVAREQQADVIVLGARRPHAFGRLVHADVRAHVSAHAPCRIHVAALQEMPVQTRS